VTTTHDLAAELLDAAVYGRISEDDDLKGEGVNEQLSLGVLRAEADPRWRLAGASWPASATPGTFRDDDISAYSGKPRPGYEALMREVVAGRVKVIIVRHLDRLWRDDVEAAQGRKTLRQHRVTVVEYRGSTYDMWTASGQHMARTMGGNATFESDIKSERIREASERRAKEGRMNGVCPYGWRREYERTATGRIIDSREVEDPEAAAIVREICHRLLAGDTLHGVTDDLNARGVRPPGADFQFKKKARAANNEAGLKWGKTSVKKLALRESNAGLRVFHRGQDDERVMPGTWPALITVEEHERLKALLAEPDRRTNHGVVRPGARIHLLTWGVGWCGVCGGVLRSARLKIGYKVKVRMPYLKCAENECVAIRQDYVDTYVGDWVAARLSAPDAAEVWLPDGTALADAQKRAQEAAELLAAAGRKLAAGEWTIDTVDAVTAATRPKLEAAQKDIDRLRPGGGGSVLAATIMGELTWDAMEVAQRRALLEAMRLRVTILPVIKQGPGFDPNRVRVEREAV